ncbi:MAG TPA: crosslink repair DNA glycosylase YcaQ family protein [Arenibaculum sp.]|nr:crosslink repair DNA glycosylase YcaQ family protein [Arenibaculum sp.]
MPRSTPLQPRPKASLRAAEARRLALGAQGYADRRPTGAVDRRHLARVLGRVALLQIDSVNVLVRSHYLPVFSRLGAYPPDLLDRAAWGRRGRRALFEYWGHEASLLPVELQPLLRWRMAAAADGEGVYKQLARFGRDRKDYVASVLREVERRGPIGAGDVGEGSRATSSWWGWSDAKHALEWLFAAGLVTVAARRGFERLYDLPERVLPDTVLASPTPVEPDAQRGLVATAARALGVATERDLRDYFRLDPIPARARIAELVEDGALLPVDVEGWRETAYLDPGAAIPRRIRAAALLSPFDSLIWCRPRTERLFGFRYRLEIYTPADRREHGYYVLPFLFGDRLVARLDLKADRYARRLRVVAAHAEPGGTDAEAVSALVGVLREMAVWLGLDAVEAPAAGDLAPALRSALADPVAAASGTEHVDPVGARSFARRNF